MALENYTVWGYREGSGEGKLTKFSSAQTWAVQNSQVSLVRPSVCSLDGETHGLTNSEVWLKTGTGAGLFGSLVKLWCQDTVAELEDDDDGS